MSTLTRAPLADSGLEISRLTLGGNTFGWTSTKDESFAVLDAFVAAGGNSIDTADSYSAWAPGNKGGESETILGAWLADRGFAGSRRDDVVVATKVSQHPDYRGLSALNVTKALDASLTRLGLNYVDIYFAHYDDPSQEIGAMAETFSGLVDAGKVRVIGLSNFSPIRMREWLDYAREHQLHTPKIVQQHYNLVERATFEGSYAPLAAQYGLATESYWALAAGFLTGKYRTPDDANGAARYDSVKKYLTDFGFAVVAALEKVAEERGVSSATVAIAWQIAKGVTSPIASARVVDQLPSLIAATGLELSVEHVELLDRASRPFA